MQNRFWNAPLHLGLMVLISAGYVVGVEPFTRSAESVLAQETSQDIEQTITGRLSADSQTLNDDSYYNAHTFTAEAGQSLLIEMVSEEFDTYLLLLDSDGNEIARNDDGENGTNARIVITIPATGEHTILANSYEAGETGTYTITIRPTTIEVVQRFEKKSEADRLFQQGIQQFRVSQFRDALASWETGLQIYQEISNRQGEAASLGNLGLVYDNLGQYERAIDYHEQHLAIAREIGDRQGEANALGNLGLVYDSLGQYERAIDYHEQSLAIKREIGDRQGEANALGNLGLVYDSLGQYETAIDYQEQSLAIARETGDRQGEAASLGNLGLVYDSLGQYERAIDYQEQSLAIDRETGNRQGEAASLGNLGNVYYLLGQYEWAIDYHEQHLAIAREIGDRQGEVNSLGNLGNAYWSLGQYEMAIDYHDQSLSINREIGDRQGEAASLGNLGNVYFSLGQYETAIDYHEQSLVIDREIGDRGGEATSLGNLGNAYWSLGQYETAIDYHEQHLAIAREIGDRQGEASSLGNLGLVYDKLGQYEQAIDYHEQYLAIAREIGDRRGEANSLGNLGNVYDSLRQYKTAINYHEQSLVIAREIGNPQGEANSLNNLGVTYLHTQQYETAERVLYSAIQVFETLRASDLPDANKVSLFETQRRSYMLLQQALVAQNKTSAALEIAERSRARALVELIATQVSERTAEEVAVTSPSLAEIQQIAQQQNTTLVSYSIINLDISDPVLYIWVVQPTGEISFQEIDLTILDRLLSELVAVSRDAIGVRGIGIVPDGDIASVPSLEDQQHQRQTQQQNLKQLYELLIAPIASQLPTNETDRVVFIPQDDLFLVPFPALIDENDQYLIENHTLSIAPSIQTLALTHRLSTSTTALTANPLIVGNPTMPYDPTKSDTQTRLPALEGAENEAVAIAQQLNTDALLWDNASETAVAAQMPNASLIHLATHGLLSYRPSSESGIPGLPGAIALAPDSRNDGLLTSAELFDMQLQAELVVLSACDTGLGDLTGEGVIGLSRSLMQAGVPSVIVSLWSVFDNSTEFLMTEFYANLNTMDKTQALRQAMLTTMQHPEYSEPLDWAAFTLIGEPE